MISNQFLYQSHLQGELDRWNRDMNHFQEEVEEMKAQKASKDRVELNDIENKIQDIKTSMERESHEGWEAFKAHIDHALEEVSERLSRLKGQ